MKQKLFLLILMILIVIPSLVLGATYHGSFDVDVSSGSIIIDPNDCEEDWSGSTWGACVDNQQIFVCFDKNQCGTTDLKPAQCGNIQGCAIEETCNDGIQNQGETGVDCGGPCGACPSSRDSSRKRSGSSSSNDKEETITILSTTSSEEKCIEKWRCSEWSNSENSCGTRTCTDINSCGTIGLKPETSRECPSAGFFDITGGVIGAVASPTGISILSILVIVTLFILITLLKKK